jgi:hypothetical protein
MANETKTEHSLVQKDEDFSVEEGGVVVTIRTLSAVPVDLEKLLQEVEQEEKQLNS